MTVDNLYSYALSLYGIPYQWGGNGPDHYKLSNYGFDCSGFVLHLLEKMQLDLKGIRTSAHLYAKFGFATERSNQRGALAFFGINGFAHHVGWMIDDKIMISAAGGDEKCNTQSKAKLFDAYVKIQPIAWYKVPQFMGAFMPDYPGNTDPH